MLFKTRYFSAGLYKSLKKNSICPLFIQSSPAYICNGNAIWNQNVSNISCFSPALSQKAATSSNWPWKTDSTISNISSRSDILEIKFTDGSQAFAPFLWLRDNCPCSQCYDSSAMARRQLLTEMQITIKPVDIFTEEEGNSVQIRWNDGHSSTFNKDWLYHRAFTAQGRTQFQKLLSVKKEIWGKGYSLEMFKYDSILKDPRICLRYLLTMEKRGAAVVTETPESDPGGVKFIEKIGILRETHFGRTCDVRTRPSIANLAYTNQKLDLHVDLPFYEHQPGIIFLHMVKTDGGIGGESAIADGFFAAEMLKRKYPKSFEKLSTTRVYFWDKGLGTDVGEKDEFFKVHSQTTIGLNHREEIRNIAHNNQTRDSFIDLPYDKVNSFYKDLHLFSNILKENACNWKLKSGEMLTLDNTRCLHGRNKFEGIKERYLSTSYADWDDMVCRRRVLQEKFPDELYKIDFKN